MRFTEPLCPIAFSAEPIRRRLCWHYGDGLRWTVGMIVLTREPGEAEKLAQGAPGLQRRFAMPIDPEPLPPPASSEPACRAVVATRLHAPERAQALLRRLRVRVIQGGLLDDPALIADAASDVGLDPATLAAWSATDAVATAIEADVEAARTPSPAAMALDHKLGGPSERRRYTAPSYLIDGFAVPGFNRVETYETVIANRAPGLPRRPKPCRCRSCSPGPANRWLPPRSRSSCSSPLSARAALYAVAPFHPAGAEGIGQLEPLAVRPRVTDRLCSSGCSAATGAQPPAPPRRAPPLRVPPAGRRRAAGQGPGATCLLVWAPEILPRSAPVYWVESSPPAFAAAAGSRRASRQRPREMRAV